MYVRLTRGLSDKGIFLPADQYLQEIDDPESKDYYVSPYFYAEEAIKYFQENEGSIKGYQGEVWTDTLFWDLDSGNNVELARNATMRLLRKLEDLGFEDSLEAYFSGNKGFHVLAKTTNKFTPAETKRICSLIAAEAGLRSSGENKTFDTTVYNTNRIFRITNTRHNESSLYKIPLLIEELNTYSVEEIRELAKERREETFDTTPLSAEFLKEKYKESEDNVVNLTVVEAPDELDLNKCPPSKRRCVYILENGHFGSGERENACIRLAAYYRGQGFSQEHVKALIDIALEKRAQLFYDLNPYTDADTERIIGEVFSKGWNGGTYSCAYDDFLAQKCSINGVPCSLENRYEQRKECKRSHLVTVEDMVDDYVKLGEEALKEYPQFGLEWLDSKVVMSPGTYSIINGSVGSGKTSLVIEALANLNQQKIKHLFSSLDMSSNAIFEKIGARHTKYTQREISDAFNVYHRNEVIMQEIINVLRKSYPYTIFDFTSAANVEHIEESIETYNQDKAGEDKIKVAFIDYAGRLIGAHDTILASANYNANKINDVCKSTLTHICLVSQIARASGDYTTPIFTDRISKESSNWEENASFIINVWRDMGHNPAEVPDAYLHVYIAKNRKEKHCDRVFHWNGKEGSIREFTAQEYNLALDHYEEARIDFPKTQKPSTTSGSGRLFEKYKNNKKL